MTDPLHILMSGLTRMCECGCAPATIIVEDVAFCVECEQIANKQFDDALAVMGWPDVRAGEVSCVEAIQSEMARAGA